MKSDNNVYTLSLVVINFFLGIFITISFIIVFLPLYTNIPKSFFQDSINDGELKIFKDKMLYNLGDLLLMPKLSHTDYWKDLDEFPEYRMAVNAYPDSILALYESSRKTPNEEIPNVETLQKAVDLFIKKNKSDKEFTKLLRFVNRKDVLCIHVRSGDYGIIEKEFKDIILNLKKQFKYAVIMCGIHHTGNMETLIESIKKIFEENGEEKEKNIFISIEDPDIHMSMFRCSQNLLIHKNGFSILAGFVFKGDKLFLCKKILYINNNYENPDGIGIWKKFLESENKPMKEIIYL